jgi:uncharacterized protein (TIGR02271 family)
MAKNTYRAIGVFTDQEFAQRAIQQLQAAGLQARILDRNSVRNLQQQGFNRDESGLYESRAQEGNTVVLAEGGRTGDEALNILLQSGAENIDVSKQGRGANYYQGLAANQRQYGPVDESLGRARTAEETRLILRREQLIPVKQAVQAGEVAVRKTVHEHQQEVPVTLAHEEVTIERRPITDPSRLNADDIGEQEIRVPVYEEQAQLQKQVTGEEVVVNKQRVEQQRTVSGTVRHEQAEVVPSGDVQVEGDTRRTRRSDANRADADTTDYSTTDYSNTDTTGANPA